MPWKKTHRTSYQASNEIIVHVAINMVSQLFLGQESIVAAKDAKKTVARLQSCYLDTLRQSKVLPDVPASNQA